MAEKGGQTPGSTKGKRVSFNMSSATADQFVKRGDDDPESTVEISAFPHAELKPVLRLNLSGLDTPRSQPKLSSRRPKKTTTQDVKTHTPRRVQSFKEPTETVKHALLRSMSHREPDEKTQRFLSKALTFKSPRFVETHHPTPSVTPRSSRNPDVLVSKIDHSKVNIRCGHCNRIRRVESAVGFCKYCAEYLCANCVMNHRNKLTRSHPVVVFYCQKCKELNILNDRGAGHCVDCKTFYCSGCVVEHCSKINHRIVEGKDLHDVVECIIQR